MVDRGGGEEVGRGGRESERDVNVDIVPEEVVFVVRVMEGGGGMMAGRMVGGMVGGKAPECGDREEMEEEGRGMEDFEGEGGREVSLADVLLWCECEPACL